MPRCVLLYEEISLISHSNPFLFRLVPFTSNLLHSYVTQIALDFMEMKRNVLQVKGKEDQRNMEIDGLIKSIVGKENVKNTSQK